MKRLPIDFKLLRGRCLLSLLCQASKKGESVLRGWEALIYVADDIRTVLQSTALTIGAEPNDLYKPTLSVLVTEIEREVKDDRRHVNQP